VCVDDLDGDHVGWGDHAVDRLKCRGSVAKIA
jgi:hypothetical protein